MRKKAILKATPTVKKTDIRQDCTVPKRILLVEDSLIAQLVHMEYLEELGYKAELAKDGEEAIKMFKNGYDLILLDIGLPKISGIEVAKEIRRYEKENGLKRNIIVALTGFSFVIKQECEKADMDDFQTKPIEINDLKKVLKQWL